MFAIIPKSTQEECDLCFESDSKISEQKNRDKPLSLKILGLSSRWM